MIEKHKTGKIGEDIAAKFLENKGYDVLARNYRKPWGEIDVICQKSGIFYFVEVKTTKLTGVPRGTERFLPEEHVHPKKLERMERTAMTYIEEIKYEGDWGFIVVAVDLQVDMKTARVRLIDNIL
jgi:putative endonuclease